MGCRWSEVQILSPRPESSPHNQWVVRAFSLPSSAPKTAVLEDFQNHAAGIALLTVGTGTSRDLMWTATQRPASRTEKVLALFDEAVGAVPLTNGRFHKDC